MLPKLRVLGSRRSSATGAAAGGAGITKYVAPKALLWFGAFIPQFVDPAGNYVGQIMLLGATAMATAALTDGAYAILGGRTGRFMSQKRIRLASQLSGLFLIGGGVWLAFTRAR